MVYYIGVLTVVFSLTQFGFNGMDMELQGLMSRVVLLATICVSVYSQVDLSEVSPEVKECIDRMIHNPDEGLLSSNTTTKEIQLQCLQTFFWKFGGIQHTANNITAEEKAYMNFLIGSYVHRRRQKRATGTPEKSPQTGFRIRREYRMLSDVERANYHAAVNALKDSGEYDRFANIHRGRNIDSAHRGPNFLGWHRVYLALYEDALRQIDSSVSLPYWDSSIDFHMRNPIDSIIWTESFLGNGDGRVTSGPFAMWPTPSGRLSRNVGGGSTLISKDVIEDILTRCRLSEISMRTARPRFDLERHHGGPHVWIGGHMRTSDTAADDPVFFMHHAFIDYIWERFRLHQVEDCRVDPTTDYPGAIGLHAAKRTMAGFPDFRNIDGIRGYWTQTWFRYEYSPECSPAERNCGSPYLRCDVRNSRCISATRTTPRVSPGFAEFARNNGMDPESANELRARAESASVNRGRVFRAPPADPRTQDGRNLFTRRRSNFFF